MSAAQRSLTGMKEEYNNYEEGTILDISQKKISPSKVFVTIYFFYLPEEHFPSFLTRWLTRDNLSSPYDLDL